MLTIISASLLAGLPQVANSNVTGQKSNGLAPEVTVLNAKDNLYTLEHKLPELETPFLNVTPEDKNDGIPVGKLGVDGGDRALIEAYARQLANAPKDETINNVDSMLISYRGKLVFESYYRRGRANFPHYQMSITKSYTAVALGRAIQLGFLKMEDLDKPAISFLKELNTAKLAPGAESITLSQAMQMSSGIRLPEGKAKELLKNPAQLKGQGEIQAYLQHSDPIPSVPRTFKYQEPDTAIVMQVLQAVVPGGAKDFIQNELLKPMGITNYQWETAVSGLPKSAAGSALCSRDMLKFGMLILNKGKWRGQQLIPEAYITRATSPNAHSYGTSFYGFFWWVEDFKIGEKTYHSIEGRGAGGQFIFMFPELDLVTVITSHDKGMGNMLATLPKNIIPAFADAGKPNVVIFLVDDMGYADIGPFGNKHKTPHLDRMAAEGLKLTDFYVTSVCCTPSRSALMTGSYAERIGMGGNVVFPADKRGLNPAEITIAEVLKKRGYATGCFGKWHLGDQPEFLPTRQGFDEYEGVPYSNDMWEEAGKKSPKKHPPLPYLKQDKVVAFIPDAVSQAVLTDAISDAAVDFIKRHAKEPFFAYVPFTTVHYPWFATPERLAAAGGEAFTAQITEIDQCVGRVMETLKTLGIDKNTLIFFTNDNGGGGKTCSTPLRGNKFGPDYEGHMRMATLAWWPGKIPAGKVTSEIGTTADLLPTLAALTGGEVPKDRIIDGKDISGLLLYKEGYHSPHDVLYYGSDGIRQGKWKLVRVRVKGKSNLELYNLDKDIGEQTNLAPQEPDRVKAMVALLNEHVTKVKTHSRPAGFVQTPKPILPHATGIPTLAEYRKQITKSAGQP